MKGEIPKAVEVPEPLLPSWETTSSEAVPLDQQMWEAVTGNSISCTVVLMAILVYLVQRFRKKSES